MSTQQKTKSYLLETIKTIVIAVIISLLLILLAAFLIGALNIADKHLDIINQVIKGVSIFISCIFCLRLPKNRWLRGIIVGVLYVLLAFFIFSAMNGKIEFGLSFLNDLAIGSITGVLSGIFALIIRKDK